jgi:outer membrane protein assembly factor BamB
VETWSSAARWRRVLLVLMLGTGLGAAACASSERADSAAAGGLVVLDAASGRRLWARASRAPRLLELAGAGAKLVVAIDSRCVHGPLPGGGDLIAFDAGSGARRWHVAQTGVATKTMVTAASSNVDVAADGVIVTPGGRGGEAAGLSARTGRRVWSVPNEAFLGVSDRFVFTSTAWGVDSVLVVHDRGSGRGRWRFPSTPSPQWSETFDVVAADDAHVVVANGPRIRIGDRPAGATTFYVLDAHTGVQLATFTAADPSLVFSDVVLSRDGLVYGEGHALVARDLTTGQVSWTRTFDDAFAQGVPGVSVRTTQDPDVVLAEVERSGSGRVVALDGRTGATEWEVSQARVRAGGPRISLLDPRPNTDSRLVVAVDTRTGRRLWQRALDTVAPGNASPRTERSGRRVAVGQVCDTG